MCLFELHLGNSLSCFSFDSCCQACAPIYIYIVCYRTANAILYEFHFWTWSLIASPITRLWQIRTENFILTPPFWVLFRFRCGWSWRGTRVVGLWYMTPDYLSSYFVIWLERHILFCCIVLSMSHLIVGIRTRYLLYDLLVPDSLYLNYIYKLVLCILLWCDENIVNAL